MEARLQYDIDHSVP